MAASPEARRNLVHPGVVLLNLVLAIAIATVISFQFLVWSATDTQPPQCANKYGNEVSCSLEDSSNGIYLATIVGIFVLLCVAAVLVRRRRSNRIS
ncbi:nitrate reductase NapE component [Marmoricola sp. OAE513]|uniref:hypothetical protein n=1 Tax=Marmoricola sp. OAE513 TaxID=2817894 RepID=UPI001AE50910